MSFLTVKRAFVVRVPSNSEPSKVICRVCRKQCPLRDQIPLFKNSTLRANASMLTLIADVKIIPNDQLPRVICLTCNNILEKAYVLRTVAQNSDKLFRKLLMQKGKSKGSTSTKKILNQKSPNKQNIQVSTPIIRVNIPNDKKKVSKKAETDEVINIFKEEPDDITDFEPNEHVSTSHDDIFSDMNDISNMQCDVKEIEIVEFEDDGFAQADYDSDPDYTPGKEEMEDDENKPTKIVNPRNTPMFSSKVTVRPRVKMVPRGSIKPKPKIHASDVRQFLMLQRQHALREKLQQKKEADRRRVVRLKRQLSGADRPRRSDASTLCSICGTLAKNMNAHLKRHQEKNIKCSLCSSAYKTQGHLNAHMKKHLGQRDFKCDLCDAAFFEKKGLVRHMLMHTQTRPYTCKICGKSFSYSNVLRNHMDIHLNRKPHSCDVCERPFRTKKHLKTHMIIHTGERPFSCEICCMQFAYKVNLNQHMARSHSANWKYKSIPKVTEEILEQERAKDALKAILPYMNTAPNEITITTFEGDDDGDDDEGKED